MFFVNFNKRQKFVLAIFVLSVGFFISQFIGVYGVIAGAVLSFLTCFFLYLILKKDIEGTFYYPILLLPFLYTLSFSLFDLLIPSRMISRFIITAFYAFGLYSLFLTQNIFAISSIRTINLLRSARIVSFIIAIVILFFLINVIFSLHFYTFVMPLFIFTVTFLLNLQSFWSYSLDRQMLSEVILYAAINSFALSQLSFVLTLWPVNATIYSIFLTGIFYTFSGLSHTWFERKLFKGVMWEFVWVGFLSIIILILFSNWGI